MCFVSLLALGPQKNMQCGS